MPCPEGYQDPALESALRKGSVDRVAGGRDFFYWALLGSARKGNMGRPHVGPPPTGGAIEVRGYVDRVVVKGRGLSGQIPGC